ncbi:MAG TPA: hypothetical protein VIV60_09930 [Polyangiaceae bacterium]
MRTGLRSSRLLSALLIGACLAGAGAVGCRTTERDVHRWGETQNGPKRLEAVITHDKYSDQLRTEAALTLIRMRPRNGKRLGIEGGDDPEQRGLLAVLTTMDKDSRSRLIGHLVPHLEAGMKLPPADRAVRRPDESYPYKDAAYALLTHDKGGLISNDEIRQRLQDGIAEWAAADFGGRMEEPAQIYSMDQVLRFLGSRGVKKLPELMQPGAAKLDRLSEFVAELGDTTTKLAASTKLVAVANYINSAAWLAEREPILRKANRDSKLNPNEKQFKEQLDAYQDEELIRLFSSMKKVGGKPVVSFLLDFSANAANGEKRRSAAMAALEGNIDKSDPKQIDALFALASAEATPDGVRDLVLRRLSELPKKLVINRLYALFQNPNWKVRFGPADLALRMSEAPEVGEFMAKLGTVKNMSMSEPLSYGGTLNDVKGGEAPAVLAAKFVTPDHPVPARLTAMSWYFRFGGAADIELMKRFEDDKAKVPECAKTAKDCEWKCEVAVSGKSEAKEITTVGEFVRFCVIPEIERRTAADTPKK